MSGVVGYETGPKHQKLKFIPGLLILVAALVTVTSLPPAGLRAMAYSILREQAKRSFVRHLDDFQVQESEHFIVSYQDQDAQYSNLVLETAEEIFAPICRDLGYTPTGKTMLVLYPDREELNESFGWPPQESAMGVYWAGVIRILSPGQWIRESDPQRLAARFRAEGPLAHEFTHLVLDYLTSGNYPRWFTEGLAQYQEYQITGSVWAETPLQPWSELYTLAEMEAGYDRLPDTKRAYYQSFLLIDYLLDQTGRDGLRQVIDSLAAGQNIQAALRQVTGLSYQEFEAQWQRWLAEKNIK